MSIAKQPFTSYKLDEERNSNDKTFTLRLTESDKNWFLPAKKYLKQPKNSTCMKQLAEIGSIIVLHDPKMSKIIGVIMNNHRRNTRLGISETEYETI